MPEYSYRCTACAHEFNTFQSIHDAALRDCPECKGAVQRLIGKNVGVQFTGSGFYVTDQGKSETGSGSSAVK